MRSNPYAVANRRACSNDCVLIERDTFSYPRTASDAHGGTNSRVARALRIKSRQKRKKCVVRVRHHDAARSIRRHICQLRRNENNSGASLAEERAVTRLCGEADLLRSSTVEG